MSDFELPVTRYAQSGEVNIAYQTIGEGPIDLIIVPGIVSHVEFAHEFPGYTRWLRRLAKFARVVTFDKRGQGLSDRVPAASPPRPRWKSAWTISTRSCAGSDRRAPRCSASPKVRR